MTIVAKRGLTAVFDTIYRTCNKGDLIWFAHNVEIEDTRVENKMILFTLDYVKTTDNKQSFVTVRDWLTHDVKYRRQYASQWQQ